LGLLFKGPGVLSHPDQARAPSLIFLYFGLLI
jgi:hypothetical protein